MPLFRTGHKKNNSYHLCRQRRSTHRLINVISQSNGDCFLNMCSLSYMIKSYLSVRSLPAYETFQIRLFTLLLEPLDTKIQTTFSTFSQEWGQGQSLITKTYFLDRKIAVSIMISFKRFDIIPIIFMTSKCNEKRVIDKEKK